VIGLAWHPGIRVHVETALDWQMWQLGHDTLILGTERYPQFIWAITVKPHVLETDPGPLDARVP
jgi:hypothetical protein